jgi:DNA-binding NtrC family response regulator
MTKKNGKILAVDDNKDILLALRLLLKPYVELIHVTDVPDDIPSMMAEECYDVILLDMNFTKDASSGKEGFFWLEKILAIDPNSIVIFITAYGDVENAVKAIKMGATDFVHKPWQNEKLLATISAGIKLRQSNQELSTLKVKETGLKNIINKPLTGFIGNSVQMLRVFESIKKVAATDASVLILGENGTGKELVARSLHQQSHRRDEVYISVDLGSIAETLFESELFGHVKGAFTDARMEKAGRFEIASGGTLFLDEIGNLSLQAQAKLLTVLERREIIRVGANKPKPIDIRLISATNMPIRQMVKEDKFREDLLYRINTVEISIPPLRDRSDDVVLLARHFIKIYSTRYKKNISDLSSAAIKVLLDYSWPGNVRELQHAIERAIILTDHTTLQASDFNFSTSSRIDEIEQDQNNFNLDDVERNTIVKVLKLHKGNVSYAAKELGLTRTSLYRRMEKYGL